MNMLKYGIIGMGSMGRSHIECINYLDGAKVIAGADTFEENRKKFEEKTAGSTARCFSDYRKLLELDEVDAVVVATPNYLHVDMVADAIAAGKHILSEKPAATSYEDLARLEREVAKSKKVYQVGLECRYLPSFRRAEKMIRDGVIGAPRMLWCHEFRGPFAEKMDNWIISQECTGGAFVEKMCHYFDLLNWFAGSRPKKVASFAGQDVVKKIYGAQQTVVDNGWVMIEYENHARAAAGLCMFSEKAHVIEVGAIGEKGRLVGQMTQIDVWDHAEDSHTIIEASPDPEVVKFSHNGGVYLEHVEFMDCILNNRKPLTDINVARYSVLVGLAAEESAAKGGCTVKID